MSKRRIAVALSLAGVVSAGTLAISQQPVLADGAPSATDVVGVGSDIIQNSVDFLADGDISGLPGYNTAGNQNRIISFSATADANGRNAFTDPLLGTSAKLNPTVVLRAGTSPVQRPNGGNAGIAALIADGDAANGGRISFVRSPNLPTAAQLASAQGSLKTPLHSVQFAADKQFVATATTTNAPAALSAAELVAIYKGSVTKWGQLAGYTGPGAGDTIVPLLPQDGAGVQTIFYNALKPANGGASIGGSLGANVRKVQQNDPSTITGLTPEERKNAIVPFPEGRYKLLNSGYFRDPSQVYNSSSPAPALSADGIKLVKTGTAPDGNAAFAADIPYYVVFRESDAASTRAWQPGSTLNWVETLFFNADYDPDEPANDVPPPYFQSSAGKAVLESIGLTSVYVDRGDDTVG